VAPARLLDFGVFVCGVYFSRFIATRERLADDFRFLLDFPMTTDHWMRRKAKEETVMTVEGSQVFVKRKKLSRNRSL
jgi:hypothetical protein